MNRRTPSGGATALALAGLLAVACAGIGADPANARGGGYPAAAVSATSKRSRRASRRAPPGYPGRRASATSVYAKRRMWTLATRPTPMNVAMSAEPP